MAQPRARRKLSDGPRPVHRRVLWHRPGDDPGASRAATGDPGRTYPLPSGSLRRFTVQPTVDAAIAAGPFDGLISNAGETVRGTVGATPLSEYERLLGLNFLGALRVAKAVLSGFRERGAAGSCRFPHVTQQRRTTCAVADLAGGRSRMPPKQSPATVLNGEPSSAKLATVMSRASARPMCPARPRPQNGDSQMALCYSGLCSRRPKRSASAGNSAGRGAGR